MASKSRSSVNFIPPVKTRSGFTILELIIYIVIFAIVATLGTSVFSFAVKAKGYVGELSEVQINMSKAVDEIVGRVHASTGIISASGSTLSLSLASSSVNPTVFSLSGGELMVQEGSGAVAPVTPSTILITSLAFTVVSNPSPSGPSVQIKITAGYNKGGVVDPATVYSIQTTAMPL